MAQGRTNMVSMIDIGKLMGGTETKIIELGDGFTELTEDWAPNIEPTQYVNMKSAASTMMGYEFSMAAEREYLSDEMQTTIDNLFKSFPTGSQCETDYYRFYKTDITANSGECIRVPVIIAPSSTGGEGGGVLTSSIQINGNGDAVLGTVTIAADGTYTWAVAE